MEMNSRNITTKDGRNLCVFDAGKPDGIPILVHHGTPESGLMHQAWIEDADAKGIRLIGYDRPGYGASSPQPDRRVSDVAEDVTAIAEALNIQKLLSWGVSGGGPHVLACAALLPELVAAAACLAAPTPFGVKGLDWYGGMGDDNIEEFGAALKGREVLEPFLESTSTGILNCEPEEFIEAFLSILCPVDVAALSGELGRFMLARLNRGIENTREGWVEDDLAFVKPWGFELDKIQIPVMLMHGRLDQMVPFAHGQWLVERIPGVETRLLDGDGHVSLLSNHISEVHTWLLGMY